MINSNKKTKFWHALERDEAISVMESSLEGLSTEEAKSRLLHYGANQIYSKKKDGLIKLLWRQINNPLIWVLLGSTVVAILIGNITDGLVVLSVIVVNTIIGFIQEYKAGKAIEALSEMVPQNALVMRNNKNTTISATEIVPGDLVFLSSGDRVPADMRLINQKNLLVEEAALTGESLPVQKDIQSVQENTILGDRKSMVYSGTLIASGTAMGLAVATGMNTELGKISDMLDEATDLQTPLTKKLKLVGHYLTVGILSITVLIVIIGTLRALNHGLPFNVAINDSLIFAIALAVGAIPEGLPAVVTIALAIGVQRMAKRKAIIRKLPAVETLGSTMVICSDKTGTLTRNEMTVTGLWTKNFDVHVKGSGYKLEGGFEIDNKKIDVLDDEILNLLTLTVLCSDSEVHKIDNEIEITGDPTEAALVVAALKARLNYKELRNKYSRIDIFPFESENQYMATLNEFGNERKLILKGAPEVILKKCESFNGKAPENISQIIYEIEKMGKNGMRVIAVAYKNLDVNNSEINQDLLNSEFSFVGLLGMIDPPREEAIEAIRNCHNAGIVVKMITGDHRTTAGAIGYELGLGNIENTITGADISELNEENFQSVVNKTNIFARVAPEHKLKLVKTLQRNNQVVAMTGDGVNDAPALKQADIGVAMGITGTSVSKESADIVLADDNFSTISAAVEEGRRVYDNLLKSLAFILPTNIGLAIILTYSIIFFPFNPVTNELLLPMLPVQLLWINLVAAIALALPLAFEAKEPNIMKRPPRMPNEPLFNRFVTVRVFLVSILMSAGAIVLFQYEYSSALLKGVSEQVALSKAQTISVSFVIWFQIFYLLNCRSMYDSILKIGVFSNKIIFIGISAIILLQALFVYLPFMQNVFGTSSLNLSDVLISLIVGILVFPVISIEKWINKIKSKSTSNIK